MTGRAHALDLVPGLAELAKAQQGVVRRDQLAGLGVTPGHVRSQVSGERWRTIGPFVVVLRNGRLTRAQQLAVGVLHAGDGALLAGRSSLETEGLRGWEVEQVHVLVARERRVRALAGVVVHRSTGLDESDATRTAWPPRTTSARATVDAASLERSPRSAGALVIAVVQQRLATAECILDALERKGSVRHAASIRRMLDAAGGGGRVARGGGRRRAREACRSRRTPTAGRDRDSRRAATRGPARRTA